MFHHGKVVKAYLHHHLTQPIPQTQEMSPKRIIGDVDCNIDESKSPRGRYGWTGNFCRLRPKLSPNKQAQPVDGAQETVLGIPSVSTLHCLMTISYDNHGFDFIASFHPPLDVGNSHTHYHSYYHNHYHQYHNHHRSYLPMVRERKGIRRKAETKTDELSISMLREGSGSWKLRKGGKQQPSPMDTSSKQRGFEAFLRCTFASTRRFLPRWFLPRTCVAAYELAFNRDLNPQIKTTRNVLRFIKETSPSLCLDYQRNFTFIMSWPLSNGKSVWINNL